MEAQIQAEVDRLNREYVSGIGTFEEPLPMITMQDIREGKIKEFDDMSDAFAYCQEMGSPVRVWVDHQLWELFPSGKAVLA